MGLLIFLLFILFAGISGYTIFGGKLALEEDLEQCSINQTILSIILGISLHTLLAHITAHLMGSYATGVMVSTLVILILDAIIIIKKKPQNIQEVVPFLQGSNQLVEKLNELISIKNFGALAITIALIFSAMMYFRTDSFGTPDNIHYGVISTISQNNLYPPSFPTNQDMSLNFYHFGTDLIGASIKTLTQLPVWEVINLQIALGTFTCFLALFVLVNFFLKSKKYSLLCTLSIILFMSINSLEFFLRELPNFFTSELTLMLKKWFLVSWTSVSHITSQLRLPSQNISFGFIFTLIFLLLGSKEIKFNELKNFNNLMRYFAIAICSFMAYFTYPTFWYPVLAGSIGFLIITRKPHWLIAVAAIYLGKVLCFNTSHITSQNIQTLIFAPSLDWYHWGKAYLRYFYETDYLKTLMNGLDPYSGSRNISIPLFSSISLRDFGFSALIALTLAGKMVFKNKTLSDKSLLLIYCAIPAVCVPFFIEFTLRPIETSRFLLAAKVFFLVFVGIMLFSYLKDKSQKTTKIISSILLIILLLPGFLSILPAKSLAILRPSVLSQKDKTIVKALEKIHKDKDRLMGLKEYVVGGDLANVAGFFGVGGQIYQSDSITKKTALYLMNPKLLQELKADYVLIDKDTTISPQGVERLQNERLFTPVDAINRLNTGYKLYKFIGKNVESNEQDYVWSIGTIRNKRFSQIRLNDDSFLHYSNRQEAEAETPRLKKEFANKNKAMAALMRRQALAKEWLGLK